MVPGLVCKRAVGSNVLILYWSQCCMKLEDPSVLFGSFACSSRRGCRYQNHQRCFRSSHRTAGESSFISFQKKPSYSTSFYVLLLATSLPFYSRSLCVVDGWLVGQWLIGRNARRKATLSRPALNNTRPLVLLHPTASSLPVFTHRNHLMHSTASLH